MAGCLSADYTEPCHRGQTGSTSVVIGYSEPRRAPVFLFATLDTKGREAAYIRDLLTSWGIPVTLVDVGALGSPAVAADVPRERIFELAGTTLEAVRKTADRGQAVTKAAEGAARLTREASRAGRGVRRPGPGRLGGNDDWHGSDEEPCRSACRRSC